MLTHADVCLRMVNLGERVYTIDPATARDLDDAIHIKLLHDGTYEVAAATCAYR